MKASLLAYILAGTLTVTGVAVGVTVAVKNHNEQIRQEQNEQLTNETDENGNYVGTDAGPGTSGEALSGDLSEVGSVAGSSNGSSTNSKKTDSSKEDTNETETPMEVAEEIVEIEGTTIEAELAIEDVNEEEEPVVSHDGTSSSVVSGKIGEPSKEAKETKAKEAKTETVIESETESETEDPKEVIIKKESAKFKEVESNMKTLQESLKAKYEEELKGIKETGYGEGG